MKQLPKVSIIINNYNYGRFLADAIDSALGQTYPNIEVTVVDDGSTDDSREVIARYEGRIQRVLKTNGGQASALNAGFAASSGDIIFFLDSDDMLLPEAAETVVNHWGQGTVRTYFPLKVIDADGMPLGRLMGGHEVPDSTLGPFGVNSPTTGNAFSREVLTQIFPIPEAEWRICADSYLSHASSLFGGANSLGNILGKYRVHGNNNIEGAKSGLDELRRDVYSKINLHQELRRLMPSKIGPFEDWMSRYPQHWLSRITSLRESPTDHPWPDTLHDLIRKAIRATWRHPYWNPRRKVAYTVFLLVYALSPCLVRRTLTSIESGEQTSLPKLLMGRRPVKVQSAI